MVKEENPVEAEKPAKLMGQILRRKAQSSKAQGTK